MYIKFHELRNRRELNSCNPDKIVGAVEKDFKNVIITGEKEVLIYFKSNWISLGKVRRKFYFTIDDMRKVVAEQAAKFNKKPWVKHFYKALEKGIEIGVTY